MISEQKIKKGEWLASKKDQIITSQLWGEYIDWLKRRKGEREWLLKQLRKYHCKKVFESALGDGCDAIYLVKKGLDVVANDIDEFMLKKAIKNAKKEKVLLKTISLDWRFLDKEVPKNCFDAILCLGNSLACLLKKNDQLKALKQFYRILKGKGILIIDERNYQYMLNNSEMCVKGKFPYSGKYVYCGRNFHSRPIFITENKIKFAIFNKRNNKKCTYSTYPFKRNELKKFIQKAGFRFIKQYSDYQSRYNPKADFYMYVCRK